MSEDPSIYLTPTSDAKYGEGYYMRGEGSNYHNYSWRPDLTLLYANYVRRHLGIKDGDTLLDIGCARGFLVKAMRMMGISAFGQDISEWAIKNCDPEVKEFVSTILYLPHIRYDWVIMKDLCEHVEKNELIDLLSKVSVSTEKGVLIIVPLAAYFGGKYVREEDEKDVTHIHRWTLSDWLLFLTEHTVNFTVSGSYYIKGIKECCKPSAMSCGFFTLTRI